MKIIFTLILVIVLFGCSTAPGGKADQTGDEARVPFRYRYLYNEL